ncbi:endonuclease/exonuclease/phosphatase family protein [Novosphingobium mangrovi (ex Huang et al. 2023)]|uniref:Endonuclease/exonuclease/phosphatase family protein n=1 Tax=Novosphingobium mangrovi (ex Huang et al. 2023) TaxID=2976432 RepID=A0ABT2I4A5_9SPHN|nr:endonuclease/exonuclease/phosphatase family protein [Novosphingobium mangrovi (ex Huang et al. 2023)]MCT2399629.1 endonuclease/exonuclease/phosphatase family protein [Novosphingobium mangrovi (ex Huang et al. 2023)]
MKLLRSAALAAAFITIAAYIPHGTPAAVVSRPSARIVHASDDTAGTLSVMTWNVKGLPMPVAFGRPSALSEIGRRLASLRHEGRQPHIVLLQEAFISEAKSIGAEGGYPYMAIGPQPDDAAPSPSLDAGFRENARWRKGEDDGKWVGSGLVILSDYPIVETARMAFPQDQCAGYDCLAAKGVLLARVAVPGTSRPVTVIDTHLNSRKASGVSVARANTAYAWQAGTVRRFVAKNVGPEDDVIFGGDFNIGHDPHRLAAAGRGGGFLTGSKEAIATAAGAKLSAPGDEADFLAVQDRAKDKEYYRPGNGSRLALRGVEIPFGIAEGGFDLSDHLGFVATYQLAARQL